MNKNINRLYIAVLLLSLSIATVYAQPADSLSAYLDIAARNNPQINADFALYKASLEKVPQAGAYPDPELEIGFFLKPMEILGGKQVADFTLMQMFPWFGTRKAARNEATEMARMAYEKFRDSRNNLYYELKSQWYQLSNLNEQEKNTQANIYLLAQLEQLALNRFAAPSARGGSMNAGGSASGMSDVLRIQMERAELENNRATLQANRRAAEAQFNALLNRPLDTPVALGDTLEQLAFDIDDPALLDSITSMNPMLTMLEAEGNAYRAKAEMDKKMSYPMFGIGLQYSLIGKTAETAMGAMASMNGKDMFMPMLKVSLPIFRRKYNAQQRESKHYWRSSELKYENTQNQLHAEYIRTREQLENALRKVNLYKKQYALSHSAYQLMAQEFSTGAASLTDVIQVERQMLDYNLKKSESIAEYNTKVAGIEKLISTTIHK